MNRGTVRKEIVKGRISELVCGTSDEVHGTGVAEQAAA